MARRRMAGPQRGMALLLFVVVAVLATLTYIVNLLSPEAIEAVRQQRSRGALIEAQEALIGAAMRYRDLQVEQGQYDRVYGYLPLPDLGTLNNNNTGCTEEGCDAANFSGNGLNHTVIGRFPWRATDIGIAPLRDGSGECLWYVVSGSHQRMQRVTPMNWDTLGQLDLASATSAGVPFAQGLSGHDLPVAIVIAPGTRLTSVNAPVQNNTVAQCGGNYVPGNYLEFTTLGPAPLNTDTAVSGDTSGQVKPIATRGNVRGDNGLIANDLGLPITADTLFNAIRNKSLNFRTDINALLDRTAGCLRDEFYSGSVPSKGKIAGADNHACYGTGTVPQGYYPSYKEMLFVVPGAVTVNGNTACAGALLFGSQRSSGQLRDTVARKADAANYLEDPNLSAYNAGSGDFSGPESFERVSATQSAARDIVRCIGSTPSFATVTSPGLTSLGLSQLASYDAATQTISLGQTTATAFPAAAANYLYGCAWRPETHAMGGGLRAYFKFRINDAGFNSTPHEGFTFTIVDGDNNDIDACGAAAQHLGYSGNNTSSPFIAPPKLAFEVDPRRQGNFNPAASSTLTNGRNDPTTTAASYRGGHVAIVYWGGDNAIATGGSAPCTAPRVASGGLCYLPAEEDDNVHGQAANTRSGFPSPPANPAAPSPPLSVPPDTPQGVYKLDPSRSSVPVNLDFHVRVELVRASSTSAMTTARVATTANIDLSAPGSAIDGVPLTSGDRVLVKDQTSTAQNGLYVWSGASSALTRAEDADTTAELAGLVVYIQQGTQNARGLWRQAINNASIGTDPLRWSNARVKLVAPATTSLSSPGTTLDGIVMKVKDRVLVSGIGVYIWNGASVAMTAASDIVGGSAVQVQQGSEASAWWHYDGTVWQSRSAKVASQGPLDLSNPGASIDGVALAAGDRVLVRAQASQAENGVYVWNGAAGTMTRATDADTASELAGAVVLIAGGSDAGRSYRQTTLAANGTLGSGAIAWAALDAAPDYQIEIWMLRDSDTTANQLNAMIDTTRPMSVLYPSFTPHLRDTPSIPYPFRNVRLGFTTGQRTNATDQSITIIAPPPTWIE